MSWRRSSTPLLRASSKLTLYKCQGGENKQSGEEEPENKVPVMLKGNGLYERTKSHGHLKGTNLSEVRGKKVCAIVQSMSM